MEYKEFISLIQKYYKTYKRQLPWRETTDPYRIVVSEIMLQQTQVSRVLIKYAEFLEAFPTFVSLAKASTADILKVWSGMGYNRRALYLQRIAEIVVKKYVGRLPTDPEVLETFPGIGKNTAGSIVAFTYNLPTLFIETNIRRVFIHFFFHDKQEVHDKEIFPLIGKTLDKKNPREWYYALMDYGAMLPKLTENPNKRSKHYVIQSKFEGSNRQMRGAILKELSQHGAIRPEFFRKNTEDPRLTKSLQDLEREGFIMKKGKTYILK